MSFEINPNFKLFDYALENVTVEDIKDFCPNDPGYYEYIREFTEILSSKTLPTKGCFEISEVLELTLYGDVIAEEDKHRFCLFRTFTNAVAVAMFASSADSPTVFVAPLEFLSSLRNDASVLNDATLTELIENVWLWWEEYDRHQGEF